MDPIVAGRGFHARDAALGRRQAPAGQLQILGDVDVQIGRNCALQISVRVQEQAAGQKSGHRSFRVVDGRKCLALFPQPGRLALENLGKYRLARDTAWLAPARARAIFNSATPTRRCACMPITGMPNCRFEPGQIEFDAPGLDDVQHIHRQDRGQAQFQHLADKIKIAGEIGGIHDANDRIHRRIIFLPAQKQIDRHHLVARSRGKTVKARQIDQFVMHTGEIHGPGLLFHRGAGIIADVLMYAGQGAEERRLARVRIADQGDCYDCFFSGGGHNISKSESRAINVAGTLRVPFVMFYKKPIRAAYIVYKSQPAYGMWIRTAHGVCLLHNGLD